MDAIILAGGLGTRLRSVVQDLPKCMAPVAGKPFIHYLLEYLRPYRINNVVLSLGYLSGKVMEWADECKASYPFNIEYCIENEPLGTGGAIALAIRQCQDRQVMVLNGDTMFSIPVDRFEKEHLLYGKGVSLALKPMFDFNRYGTVILENGRILSFKEKEYCKEGLINGGIYMIDREAGIFDNLNGKFSFEKDVLEPLAQKKELAGFVYDRYFIDIGIPQDFDRAQTDFSNPQ